MEWETNLSTVPPDQVLLNGFQSMQLYIINSYYMKTIHSTKGVQNKALLELEGCTDGLPVLFICCVGAV